MSRTYLPSKTSEVVALWRDDLKTVNRKAAEALADPGEYVNLFPNFDLALQAEKIAAARYASLRPASDFPMVEANPLRDPIEVCPTRNGCGFFCTCAECCRSAQFVLAVCSGLRLMKPSNKR